MKFAAVMAVAAAEELSATDFKFMNYVTEHGRSYATKEEYNFRLKQFAIRVAEHERWNAIPGQTSTQGVNFLTDRTDDEIKKRNGYRPNASNNLTESTKTIEPTDVDPTIVPIDWRDEGAVTRVKDQGQCGSCWAFSATGNMEAQYFINNALLTPLSESNLVDCSWLNHGCNGGNVSLAFLYAQQNPLMTELEYPYVPRTDLMSCNYIPPLGVTSVMIIDNVISGSVANLYYALISGPVSVAVEADMPIFHQYTGGVITDPLACGNSLDHAALIVGYGDNGPLADIQPYWIVKNSWGPLWGQGGYVKIGAVEGPGVCGIQMQGVTILTN